MSLNNPTTDFSSTPSYSEAEDQARFLKEFHKLSSNEAQSECMLIRNHVNLGTIKIPVDIKEDDLRQVVLEILADDFDMELSDSSVVTRMGKIIVVNDRSLGYGSVAAAGSNDVYEETIIEGIYADDISDMSPSEIMSLVDSGKFGRKEDMRFELVDSYIYLRLPDGFVLLRSEEDKRAAELAGDVRAAYVDSVFVGGEEDVMTFYGLGAEITD